MVRSGYKCAIIDRILDHGSCYVFQMDCSVACRVPRSLFLSGGRVMIAFLLWSCYENERWMLYRGAHYVGERKKL